MKRLLLVTLTAMGALFICSAHADPYEFATKIGDKEFNDLVVFTEFSARAVQGSLTVPGIFTAKLQGKLVGQNLKFSITAVENGQSFQVQYEAEVDRVESFRGVARLEDGSLLGSFVATRLVPVTRCR